MPREDVRAKVLAAGRKVFSLKGYGPTRVSDIISEAGIARATFYRYFPDKRQVFMEVIGAFLDTLYDTTRGYMLAEPFTLSNLEERMHRSLEYFYNLFLENRELMSVYFHEQFGRDAGMYAIWDNFDMRMVSIFSKVIDEGKAAGVFRRVNTQLVSRALLVLFMQVPYHEIMVRGNTAIDVEGMAREMTAMAMRGLMMRTSGDEQG